MTSFVKFSLDNIWQITIYGFDNATNVVYIIVIKEIAMHYLKVADVKNNFILEMFDSKYTNACYHVDCF